MLNIAIDPETPFWLICPYDAVTLSAAVVEEAHRSHPVITVIDDVLLGRRRPVDDEHDGLWHANQLCDLVQMRSSSAGTMLRVHAWK
jgi:hypothetical protein